MIVLFIGKEGKAFVAEPLPEPAIVEVEAEADEREEVLVPVAEREERDAIVA